MLSSNELSYEQEICNILKETKIHQKLEELKERTNSTKHEHAFNVCSDGRVTEVIEGGFFATDVSKIHKECNNKIDISFHSHPSDNSYPSSGDFLSDMNSQIRIASCVYGAGNDKVTCYRTSDAFRNKFKPILDEARRKSLELSEAEERATDPKEQLKLWEQAWRAHRRFEYIVDKISLNIVRNIYPNIDIVSMYRGYRGHNPKFGNFGDVWVKDCGKI
jgi:proteasome lid subunit RPN8/RPN11